MNIISRLLFRYFGNEALVEYVQLKQTPPEIEHNMACHMIRTIEFKILSY